MIASLWIFIGLLAVVFAGGAILGGGAVYLWMTRRDIADEPAEQLEIIPPRLPNSTAAAGPLGGRWDPAAYRFERLPRPVEWESPTEQFARLERQLVELAPALAVSIANSERTIDEYLASGVLARPQWVGAR